MGPVAGEPNGHGIYKVGSPYQINGVWYYPAEDFTYDETGIASWYGEDFHGKYTANGEVFDLNGLTAAHRTLPFGTKLRVTFQGKSVVVRVNDRGPYAKGRGLDLSKAAFAKLAPTSKGVIRVCVARVR